MAELSTDLRIKSFSHTFEDHAYRTPIKFGGVALDRATILDVSCEIETVGGKIGHGFGSMPMGNVWSFPSRRLSYDQTLGAMKALVERVNRVYGKCRVVGHPIDVTCSIEEDVFGAAEEVTRELGLEEPIPKLCSLVVASAFDAALHDAFGKAHGLNCYHTYSREFLPHDLGHYLGAEFAGDHLESYIVREPKPRLPLYHLVGALDPLEEHDVQEPISDGLPETLPEWIRADGLTHLKIKLNGDNLDWDVERVSRIEAVTARTQSERGIDGWHYSLDFNERCENVGYLLEFLAKLEERSPAAFARVDYIEQPTARELASDRDNVMHEAAKLRPVVIDESLLDLETLRLAREMGYTGAALKACKGQSQSLLMAAAAQKYGMFLCVQDLTCPGASLLHSAGLAAHVPSVSAIESNARQYCPGANEPWREKFEGIFTITDGTMQTGVLTGLGLGAR